MADLPPGTDFGARLVACNGLDRAGFQQWVLHPGMLFGSLETWWGEGSTRERPHEGLDLCLYQDASGRVHGLGGSTRVPVMYHGEVAAIRDDFLGRSVFVRHPIDNGEGQLLYTVYGHTSPGDGMRAGRTLDEGEVLATVAAQPQGKTRAPAHVHLTVAWVPEALSVSELNWQTIGDPRRVVLLDPLRVASLQYAVLRDIG